MARKPKKTNGGDGGILRPGEAREGAEGATAGHNAQARSTIMAECAGRMRGIKASRAELNEDASAIRKRLRDNGIDVKSWEAALRMADMGDETARDTYIDGLREAMSALGVGAQGDLFPGSAPADAADAEKDAGDPRPRFLRDKHEAGETASNSAA